MDKKKLFIIASIVFGVLALSVIVMGIYIHNLNYKLDISEHNFDAAQDKIEHVELENGKLLSEKKAFILSEKEMMEKLDISKEEMKDLKKKVSEQSVYISKLESGIKIDTVHTVKDSIIYVDNTPKAVFFKYADPWLKINGKTDLDLKKTTLFDISAPIPLTVGITDKYTVYAISENPHFKITDIHAVALENYVRKVSKKKHWHFGVYGGFGLQYGLFTNALDVGPQFGAGLMYQF